MIKKIKMKFIKPEPKRIFEVVVKFGENTKKITVVSENSNIAKERVENIYGKDSILSRIKTIG